VVVLLTWLYLSSYVLLFGAELNCEVAREARASALPTPDEQRETPSALLVAAEVGGLVGQAMETLPFSLAAIGLSLMRQRGKGGQAAALIAIAAASVMWRRNRR